MATQKEYTFTVTVAERKNGAAPMGVLQARNKTELRKVFRIIRH